MMPSARRLAGIRALIFDVDGIFTDNGLYIAEDGSVAKRFNVLDGGGIKFAAMAGLMTGIISGHDSQATVKRAQQLGMTFCHVGVKDKVPVYEKSLADLGLAPAETLYMGDDFMDLPLLRRAGLAVTVPEADPLVREACDFVTTRAGGHGAVREAVEWLLKARGDFDAILKRIV